MGTHIGSRSMKLVESIGHAQHLIEGRDAITMTVVRTVHSVT